MTNADKIRAMTDEELASVFVSKINDYTGFFCPIPNKNCAGSECSECFIAWLKQEVEE